MIRALWSLLILIAVGKTAAATPLRSCVDAFGPPGFSSEFLVPTGLKIVFRSARSAESADAIRAMEQARDLQLRLLKTLAPRFSTSRAIEIRYVPEARSGIKYANNLLFAPTHYRDPLGALSVSASSPIAAHEFGHALFDDRFTADPRLDPKIRLHLEAAFTYRLDELIRLTAHSDDRGFDDDQSRLARVSHEGALAMIHSNQTLALERALGFFRRYRSFTELMANLIAKAFEAQDHVFDELVDRLGEASAVEEAWSSGSKASPERIQLGRQVSQLEKGFEIEVDPDLWQKKLEQLKLRSANPNEFVSSLQFSEFIFAPFRGWLGRTHLSRAKSDRARLKIIDAAYEAVVSTFLQMDSLAPIETNEIARLNKIMMIEFKRHYRTKVM